MSDDYSHGGLKTFLTTIAQRLEREVNEGASPSYKIVHTFARIGDREKTLYWIERCIDARASLLIKMASDRNFDFVRSEPRFKAALARINFPIPAQAE